MGKFTPIRRHLGPDLNAGWNWCIAHIVTCLFVVSLGPLTLLIALSQHGIGDGALAAIATIYGLSGLAWVGAQFVLTPDGAPPTMPWRALALVLIVEAQLLIVFIRQRWSLGIVVALVAMYLVLGNLVNRMRSRIDRAEDRGTSASIGLLPGLVVTALAIVGFVLTAKQVPHHRNAAVIGGMVLAIVVVLPLGLNLLSATLMRISARRWIVATVGAAIVVPAFIAMLLGTHTWKGSLAILLVVAVVMLGLVSNTQLDVVLVVIVIGVVGSVLPEQTLAPPYQPAATGHILASFGDSYMSGEGARTFFKGTDQAGGNQCRRAPTAWAALAVAPGHQTQTIFDLNSLAFVACSGAVTTNVETDGIPQGGTDATQIPEYQALQATSGTQGKQPSLAVVSLGGNDAGFSTIGQMCLAPGDCSPVLQQFVAYLPIVAHALETAYRNLHTAMPGVPLVAIPYPAPIDLTAKGCQIALSTNERRNLNDFLAKLDEAVEWAADREHVYFAGTMVDALRGHQLCDPKPGLNFVTPYSVSGAAAERFNPANWIHDSLHPNERGHGLMFCAFTRWLSGQSTSSAPGCGQLDLAMQRRGQSCGPPLAAPATPGQPCRLLALAPVENSPPQLGPPPPPGVTLAGLKKTANSFALSELADDVWPFALVPLGMIVGFALLWGAALGALREAVEELRRTRPARTSG
jgi:hypothetical protein